MVTSSVESFSKMHFTSPNKYTYMVLFPHFLLFLPNFSKLQYGNLPENDYSVSLETWGSEIKNHLIKRESGKVN